LDAFLISPFILHQKRRVLIAPIFMAFFPQACSPQGQAYFWL
jgi:hypothetical protein